MRRPLDQGASFTQKPKRVRLSPAAQKHAYDMENRYYVKEFTKDPKFAILAKDGSLNSHLMDNIREGKSCVLDFSDIELIAAPFLNEVLGPLYKIYTKDRISSLVSFENLSETDMEYVKYCCGHYDKYYEAVERI